ncbi:hypothetical protein [Pseudomonas protegens]|uniref:hypothetical protein n=1 Tax=Pseudomonas protegens TaxID=380021 RepID=UPI00179C70BB|nr:hypothetical protein [Pseudomonas protegens]
MSTRIPPFSSQHLEAACRVLADTERGLRGTQIGYLLQDIRVPDADANYTKWKRLFQRFGTNAKAASSREPSHPFHQQSYESKTIIFRELGGINEFW